MIIKAIHVIDKIEKIKRELKELKVMRSKIRPDRRYQRELLLTIENEERRLSLLKNQMLHLPINKKKIQDQLGETHRLSWILKQKKGMEIYSQNSLLSEVKTPIKNSPQDDDKKKPLKNTLLPKDSKQKKTTQSIQAKKLPKKESNLGLDNNNDPFAFKFDTSK